MQLSRIYAIVLRQMYLLRGSMARVVSLFAWVAIDIVLWGFITKYLNIVTGFSYNFVPIMLGAILLWDFLTRVMQGVTMAFFEDVWARNFLNIFATPLSIGEYITGLVATSILTSIVGLAVMFLLATMMFNLSFMAYGTMLVPFLFVLFLCGIALGIFGCAIVLKYGPAAEWFIWPIPAFISPFACVFYPMSTLPGWMQTISHVLPPAYVFEGMRSVALHNDISMGMLLAGAWLALGYIMAASWFFARVFRRAVKTGLIARYSAETVS